MDVSRIRTLRGPNLWSRHTCIEAIVACEPQELDLEALPGFEKRLRELFPAVGPLQPSNPQQERLSLAHVLEDVVTSMKTPANGRLKVAA